LVSDHPKVSVYVLQDINAIAETAIAVRKWCFMLMFCLLSLPSVYSSAGKSDS
jgi:hypothetical protein